MRIGIIIRYLTRTGGATREVFMLARELQKRGHLVTLYTFAYDPATCFPGEFEDIRVVALENEKRFLRGRGGRLPLVGSFLNRFLENQKARSLAKQIDPHTDVLNPHDQISVHVAYFVKKIKKIPSVWMVNDLDIRQWSIFDHPTLRPSPRPWHKRLIARIRDSYENARYFRSQDELAFIVDQLRERTQEYLGRGGVVVRSGLDLDRFRYRERSPIQDRQIRICCQGIFYVYRRFEDVIRAVKILRDRGFDPHLRIIGDSSHKDTARAYYQSLVTLVHDLGIEDRVAFAGVVSEEELNQSYYEADVFVFPSFQTWGLAIFEALATGLPVVLARDAGAAEVLRDRQTALFAHTGDPEDVARAIQELVENPALYKRLSREGGAWVRSHLSWSQYADRMMELFHQVRHQ